MNDLLDLSDEVVAIPESQAFDAIVAEDRTDLDPVRVVVPEFDRTLGFGPATWRPVVRPDGLYYPKKGDRAVILRPNPESLWIVSWQPTADEADALRWFADFIESE